MNSSIRGLLSSVLDGGKPANLEWSFEPDGSRRVTMDRTPLTAVTLGRPTIRIIAIFARKLLEPPTVQQSGSGESRRLRGARGPARKGMDGVFCPSYLRRRREVPIQIHDSSSRVAGCGTLSVGGKGEIEVAIEGGCGALLIAAEQVLLRSAFPQGLKPAVLLLDLTYGLKPVPFTFEPVPFTLSPYPSP